MAECKECLYYEVCADFRRNICETDQKRFEEYKINSNGICDNFKNKADFVEVDKVAEMFAEQFGDKCPCNFNDNDEWLPYVCEHANTCDCPCKEGWKQFIKHYGLTEKEVIPND